jgi:hypothetical protein
MIKVKEGYAKLIGTTYAGSADRVLLSNGGDKALSDFAAASALGNYVTLATAQTITGLKTLESSSNTVGVSLKLRNTGWRGDMSTAIDFYNGGNYTVPNARIETKMVGDGRNGGTLIFYTQTKHASTNPNPNGLTERFRIGDDGTAKISATLTASTIKFPADGGIIQTTATTSTAVSLINWYKGDSKDTNYSYSSQIGWHNIGDTDGAIYLIPNPQNTQPWFGTVGLYIGKNTLKWNNQGIIHSGNIGSQSVNYANSAGSIAWVNVSGKPTKLSDFTADVGIVYGYGTSIPSNADLNSETYQAVGIYCSGSSATSTTIANAPWKSSGFRLITLRSYMNGADDSQAYGTQLAFTSQIPFWRTLGSSNGNPSSWYVLPTLTYDNTIGSTTTPIYYKGAGVFAPCSYTLSKSVPSDAVFTDTKNTARSTNSSSKLFLIGATSQAANPQTYSHDTAYVGTDGCLYSNSTKVSVEGHTHSYLPLTGGKLTGDLVLVDGDTDGNSPKIIFQRKTDVDDWYDYFIRGYANGGFQFGYQTGSSKTEYTIATLSYAGLFSGKAATAGIADTATTATKLATARNINGVSFNGTSDITI